ASCGGSPFASAQLAIRRRWLSLAIAVTGLAGAGLRETPAAMTAGWRGLNMIMLNSRASRFHDGSANSSENTTVQADAGRFAGRWITPLRFHSTALPNSGARAP